MTQYVAIINVPGYMPMDDDPPVFDTAREAWSYLAEERERGDGRYIPDDPEDPEGPASEDPTYACLVHAAEAEVSYVCGNGVTHHPDDTGAIYGRTPDSDSPHDLGLAYCVQIEG